MYSYTYPDELEHYGVVGMKWGVRRAQSKMSANAKLQRKALNYDKRSAVLAKKSERAHAKRDLARANRKMIKSLKYETKASKYGKKALNTDDELKRLSYERRSETLKYKAAKKKVEGNRISKQSGYGRKAMRYSVKSDKVAAKAAKARMEIAKNKSYVAMMNRKISSLSEEELRGAYSFVNELLNQ